jgi:subtilisin family serine protease
MSFGWFLQPTDPTLTDLNTAIDYAYSKFIVLCAATMNNGNEILVNGSPQVIPNGIHYPANYYPAVIACGASNCLDNRCDIHNGIRDFPSPWKGSNYGDQLSVVAPGTKIPTTTIPNYDLNFWGTSAATPHIAGLAALLMSHYSQLKRNPAKVREIIERTADKVPYVSMYNSVKASGSWNNEMGYGRINVYRALSEGSNYLGPEMGGDITSPMAPQGLLVQ